MKKKYMPIDIYCALSLYSEGIGGPTIAKMLNIKRQMLYKWQDYFGLKRRKSKVGGAHNKKWSDDVRNEVISRYRNGEFPYQIVKDYPSMATGTIQQWVYITKIVRGNTIGKNNSHWKGGIGCQRSNNEKKIIKWRMEIFERDSFKCQCCGNIGGELNAHHILSWSKYPEVRYDVNNGVTLCRDCHFYKIHKFIRRII